MEERDYTVLVAEGKVDGFDDLLDYSEERENNRYEGDEVDELYFD